MNRRQLVRVHPELRSVAERALRKVEAGEGFRGVRTPVGSRLRRRYGAVVASALLLQAIEREFLLPDHPEQTG